VEWREEVAREKTRRFANEDYWGKPVPAFGDPRARLLIVGLAPAAHGANRTGRMFTGDRSGDWLYRALHRAGFANQANSVRIEDGLKLKDCYITAAVRCAPPQNKPTLEEIQTCESYLEQELNLLKNIQVILGLGKIGFDLAYHACRAAFELPSESARFRFAHGAEYELGNGLTLMGSYHPSQQNTFTGRLTEEMFDAVFHRISDRLEHG